MGTQPARGADTQRMWQSGFWEQVALDTCASTCTHRAAGRAVLGAPARRPPHTQELLFLQGREAWILEASDTPSGPRWSWSFLSGLAPRVCKNPPSDKRGFIYTSDYF